MATKNIVPRASGEGGLGTSSKLWKEVHHVTASFGDTSLIEDASNNLNLSGGPLVASSGLSGSLTQLSDGSSFIIEGSNMTVTSASNGAITLASTDTDTTYTAGDGLALSSTTFSARSSVAVTVANSKFVIDGTSQQTLSLAKGVVYYFDQSDASNSSHPLRFSETSDNSGNSEFTTGVTYSGTPGNAGAYTQVILEQDAPSVLYYYCSNHSGMGGKAETAPDALLTGDRTFANNLTVTGDLTVNGTTTTVNTENLLVEDPVVLLGSGASAANTNGGIALLSGSSVSNESLVIGRVANDTWGVGRKDVTGGSVTSLADMTLVDFKAAGITASGLTLGSTAVTSTATELNLLDTSAISAASGSSLRYDGSSLQWEAFSGGGGGGLSNVVEDTTPQLGGTLDLNSQAVQGNLVPSAADTYSLGSSTAEWADAYLADGGRVYFGNDQDVYIQHVADQGLDIIMNSPTAGEPRLTLHANNAGSDGSSLIFETTAASLGQSGDILGSIDFRGYNSLTALNQYVTIQGIMTDLGSAGETGKLDIKVYASGSNTSGLTIEGTSTAGISTVDVVDHNGSTGGLKLGGTLVTATATELNLLDASSISVASGSSLRYDGTNLQWEAFSGGGGGGGLSNIVEDTSPQLGGHLDINGQTISGSLLPATVDNYDLGSTSNEWRNLYLSDAGKIIFGEGQDLNIERQSAGGLAVTMNSGANNSPQFWIKSVAGGTAGPVLYLNHDSASPANNDTIGTLAYMGDNSGGLNKIYSKIIARSLDVTNSSERSDLILSVLAGGANASAISIEGTTTSGVATVDISNHDGSTGGLKLGGTLVTATAAELNLLDGATSATSTSVADADRVILNDNGTMVQVAMSDIKSYTNAGLGGGGGGGGKHGLTETKSASFTTTAFVSAEERQLYIVDSASAVTATLADPGATTYDGYEINIKRLGSGTVHITGSTGVLGIDGSATFDLPSQYSSVTLVATGSQYVII